MRTIRATHPDRWEPSLAYWTSNFRSDRPDNAQILPGIGCCLLTQPVD
jgi:hypothetical protein